MEREIGLRYCRYEVDFTVIIPVERLSETADIIRNTIRRWYAGHKEEDIVDMINEVLPEYTVAIYWEERDNWYEYRQLIDDLWDDVIDLDDLEG